MANGTQSISGSAAAASRSARAVASAKGQPVWRRKATTEGCPSSPGSGSSRAGSPGSGGLAVGSGSGGTKVRRFTAAQVTLRVMRVRALAVGAVTLTATVAGTASAAPVLVTRHNAIAPAVGGGRVFWAQQHGRHAALLTAAPGRPARTIFRLTGPHAAHSPYAEITAIAASTRFVAFTVSTGYGDPYTCPAIDEHPAGDSRCRAGRETFNALYAGPIGGPYRRLAGVTGERTTRCRAGSAAGTIDISGGALAYAEVVVHCSGDIRSATSRMVVQDHGGAGRVRVLAGCHVHRSSSPQNDGVAVAGQYLAWSPDACDWQGRIRLFRWPSGKLVYRLPLRYYLRPFDVAKDGTVIGQPTLSVNGQDEQGYLAAFPPRRHPHPVILPRFGTRVDAVGASRHALAVGYAPDGSSSTDVLVTSDRQGNHRVELSSELDSVFAWMDFDGSVAAWAQGDPPTRLYASEVRR
jgi:hypothetical protein